MMRRSLPVVALILAALTPLADAQDARPRPHDGDRSPQTDDMPAAPLRVHEWAVWQLDPTGHATTRATVNAEAPAFVHRAPGVPVPHAPEIPEAQFIPGSGPGQNFDKPVVFLYATTALDVNVTVRVPHGQPWLYFPDATLGRTRGVPALQWTGRALPVGTPVSGATLPSPIDPPPNGGLGIGGGTLHEWWNTLRAVNASPFVPTGAQTYEKFLYYDGEAPFPAGFRTHGTTVTPVVGHVEPVAWLVDGAHFSHLDVAGTTVTTVPLANAAAAQADLMSVLQQQGLSQAEARSLVATWEPALFRGTRHLVWILPRAAYDAMLPIEIHPMPLEVVRVGVVIQHT